MDTYKLKWKMKFRLKKLNGFFKLCEYNFRYKFNLEGDDQFARHLIRQNLKELVKTDSEQEYLEMHGLLPDESEPEPEPEPEKETDLLRELGFVDLIMTRVTVGEAMYMLTQVREYEDRIYLKISKAADWDVAESEFTLPHQAEEQYVNFEADGLGMCFDLRNLTMCIPEN